MTRITRFRPLLVLAVMIALAPCRAAAVPIYSVTDLGPRYVTGLNDSGQIIGSSSNYTPVWGAPFLYQNGTFTDLSSKVGPSAALLGINNAGQITGTTDQLADATGNGFVVNPDGKLTTFPPAPGQSYAYVDAINNNGDFILQSGNHLSLYQNGKSTDLSFLGQGLSPRWMIGINGLSDAGHIIGSNGSNGTGFVYQNGKVNDLGSLGAGVTYPSGVNASGQVVGQSNTSYVDPADSAHAFLYQNGKMTDLGTLGGPRSYALGINALGQVVGTSDYLPGVTNANFHAFLFQKGTMFDLNRLIPGYSGWLLEQAQKINDKGQIVGNGINPSGQMTSFLLTPVGELSNPPPVPEPSTLAFFGLVLAGCVARGVRHWSC
jgi:probable HAF family extracellular repeat protein